MALRGLENLHHEFPHRPLPAATARARVSHTQLYSMN